LFRPKALVIPNHADGEGSRNRNLRSLVIDKASFAFERSFGALREPQDDMMNSGNWTSRFAVRGVFWREYLDWATINMPVYTYPVLYWFMTFFFFFFAAPARRIVFSNLATILPGSSRAMNYLRVFRTFHNYARTISEAAIYKLIKEEFSYEIIGANWLDQLGVAQGAIVLTAHMGNYDLGAALFAEKFNREIRLVRAPEPDRQTAQHLSASLEKSGEGAVKVNYNTAGALLSFDLLNALRLGEIVSIQGDRVDDSRAGITAHLFGRQVRLPTGPFVLAQIAHVPIYPLFIARSGYRSYQIIVREPIAVLRSGRDRATDIVEAVGKWSRVLEQLIAKRWDQWFAFAPGFLSDEQDR
jgi:phosphatidylinositol dimannoside acyltransferase